MTNNRYLFLDGLRGIAAAIVLMRHTGELWGFMFDRGYLAVDMFFILSGFVIAHAYGNALERGEIQFSKFVGIRLLRLYPVYLLSLAVAALAWYLKGHNLYELPLLLLATAFFIPLPDKNGWDLFPLNPPYWSIFYELIANFAYALTNKFLTTKILVFLIAILCALLALIAHKFGGLDVGTGAINNRGQVFSGLVRANLGFLGGLLLYQYHGKLAKILPGIPPIVAVLVATALLTMPSFGKLNTIFDLLAVLVIIPITLIIAARSNTSRFESALSALGAASYPVYLLHAPLNHLIVNRFGDKLLGHAPLSGITFLIGLGGVSILLERCFDTPLRRLIQRKMKSKKKPQQTDQLADSELAKIIK